LLCLLCAACTNKAVYHQYQAIDHFVWEKDREYYFTFMIDDAQAAYHLTFEVRNNNLYPYQNLWLFCAEEPPAGNIRRDTMECMLADAFGQWYGDGISLFQTGFPLRTAYRFPMPGQYTFSFRQGMRNDALQGIQEIGLRIEKAE
jgi:gliding motility-associated lipoprotein GldH